MKKNKLFIASVTATITAVGAVSATEATSSKFLDVKEGNSHYAAIMELAQRGIVHGYSDGTFKPNEIITYKQAAKIIAGVIGLEGSEEEMINSLMQAGILQETMSINKPVTRYQMAAFISKALQLPTADMQTNPFTDVTAEYQQAVTTLFAHSITTGTSATTFSGDKFVTRGQLASFTIRAEQAMRVQKETVEIIEAKLTVDDIQQGKLISAEQQWTMAQRVQTLLNEKNAHALAGARIQAIIIDNEIVDILAIVLNVSGQKEQHIVFDGGNSTFAGDLFINANGVELKNLTVTKNIIVTPKAVTSFSMNKVKAENLTIIYGQQPIVTASLAKVRLANTADEVLRILSTSSSATNLNIMPNNQQNLDSLTGSKIEALVSMGILNDTNNNQFNPAASITRQELAATIAKALGQQGEIPNAPTFTDIPTGAWYTQAIEAARKIGQIEAPSFSNTGLTREELALLAARTLGTLQSDVSKQVVFEGDFYARQAILFAQGQGLIAASDINFTGNMNDIATRLLAQKEVSSTSGSSTEQPALNRTPLQQEIDAAVRDIVAISTDGLNILPHQQWTTVEANTKFQQAIEAAKNTYANAKTGTEIQLATQQLQQARQAYSSLKQQGRLMLQTEALQESIRVAKAELANIQNGELTISPDGKNVPRAQRWVPQHIVEALKAQIEAAEAMVSEIGTLASVSQPASASMLSLSQQTIDLMVEKLNRLSDVMPLYGLKEIIEVQNALTGGRISNIDSAYEEIQSRIFAISQEFEISRDQLHVEGNRVIITLHEAIAYLNPVTMTMEEFIPAITVQLEVQDIVITGAKWRPEGLLLTTTDSVQVKMGTKLTLTISEGQKIVGTVAENEWGGGIYIKFGNIQEIYSHFEITAIKADGYRFTLENGKINVGII